MFDSLIYTLLINSSPEALFPTLNLRAASNICIKQQQNRLLQQYCLLSILRPWSSPYLYVTWPSIHTEPHRTCAGGSAQEICQDQGLNVSFSFPIHCHLTFDLKPWTGTSELCITDRCKKCKISGLQVGVCKAGSPSFPWGHAAHASRPGKFCIYHIYVYKNYGK